MRILSQDGKIDFPYEKVCLEVSDSGKIFAQGDIWGAEDNYIEVAAYENETKARKAMEMLREEYTGMPSIRRMDDLYGRFKHTGKKDFELFIEHMVLKKCYFQFPADDEVEV